MGRGTVGGTAWSHTNPAGTASFQPESARREQGTPQAPENCEGAARQRYGAKRLPLQAAAPDGFSGRVRSGSAV